MRTLTIPVLVSPFRGPTTVFYRRNHGDEVICLATRTFYGGRLSTEICRRQRLGMIALLTEGGQEAAPIIRIPSCACHFGRCHGGGRFDYAVSPRGCYFVPPAVAHSPRNRMWPGIKLTGFATLYFITDAEETAITRTFRYSLPFNA